jgi:cell volume regulation protein A
MTPFLFDVAFSSESLVVIALIIIIGYISTAVFRRTRIPELLILMLIGIFLVRIVNIVPANYLDTLLAIAPVFGSLALVVIMFNGSKGLKFESELVRNWKGLAFGILDIVLSVAIVSVLMRYAFGWPTIYGAILGAILGSTSTVVVIPFIRKVKINQDIFNSLFIETTVNSLVSIVVFSVLLVFINGQSFSAFSFTSYLLDYVSVAVVMGFLTGIGWIFIINNLKGAREYAATLAMAILLYGMVGIFNGASIIAVLIFGMIIGNEETIINALNLDHFVKRVKNDSQQSIRDDAVDERPVENELEFLIRTFFFVFMGMIVVLSVQYLVYGIIITLLLVLARYVEVGILLGSNTPVERSLALSLTPKEVTVATLATVVFGFGGFYFTQTFYISFMVIVVTGILSSFMLNRVKVEVKK